MPHDSFAEKLYPMTPVIPRRRFGRTALAMPVLSCGGMRYQHAWRDVPAHEIPDDNQRNLEATIHRALDLGINHIETARGYGSSEQQLGRILPTLARDRIIVQTKVNPFADPGEFRATFAKSLAALRLEYVDLLALHGINTDDSLDWSLRKGGCLEAARQLQREGRCRHVGFSTHGLPRIIEAAIESGGFDYVNLHWYWVNPFTGPAVAAAARHDMGVFIISPTEKGGMLHPAPRLAELCAPLSPIAFNVLYCLARPEVHTLSVGASRPGDFDAQRAALDRWDERAPLSQTIADRLRGELERVHGRDWCDHWHEGIPEWSEIPGRINVHEILRLWTYAKALDMVAWARMRYNLLGQGGHWFPGENAAHIDTIAVRAALKANPFRDRIPGILAEAHELLADAPKKRLSQE